MRSVLRSMVNRSNMAGGRGHPVYKTETQATTLMARRLGPSGLSHRLSHSSNMMDYVTIIYKQEIERIKAEIRHGVSTRDVSVIFDGSTRQG